jgi:hypothetical protein
MPACNTFPTSTTEDHVREGRLRRLAQKQEVRFVNSRSPWVIDYGNYSLVDVSTNSIAFGLGLYLDDGRRRCLATAAPGRTGSRAAACPWAAHVAASGDPPPTPWWPPRRSPRRREPDGGRDQSAGSGSVVSTVRAEDRRQSQRMAAVPPWDVARATPPCTTPRDKRSGPSSDSRSEAGAFLDRAIASPHPHQCAPTRVAK